MMHRQHTEANDVVTELRRAHSRLAQCPNPIAGACIRCTAAKEIEQLRANVRLLASTIARRPYAPTVERFVDDTSDAYASKDPAWDDIKNRVASGEFGEVQS